MTSNTWPCVSSTLEKVTCPVYMCTVAYTEQVTFYKEEKNTAMFKCNENVLCVTACRLAFLVAVAPL